MLSHPNMITSPNREARVEGKVERHASPRARA